MEDVRLEKAVRHGNDSFPEPLGGEFAFAGRSNVGKSSLLNALVGRRVAFVSKNPGKTRTINFYLVNHKFYLVDLPGYGYARVSKSEREEWRRAVERYFRERSWNLRILFALIDARHELMEPDRLLLEWLDVVGVEPVVLLTKVDKLGSVERRERIGYFQKLLPSLGVRSVIPCSSVTRENIDKVWELIVDKL